MSVPIITAAIMIIGNEILSGQTHDTNMNYIASSLNQTGIDLMEARVVRDDAAAIIDHLRTLKQTYHHVFTTGGIGPTHDDITTACVAQALDVAVVLDAKAKQMLLDFYGAEGLTPARLKMAQIPAGAKLIANPVSGAPGYSIANIHVLAGVPDIMQAMFQNLVVELGRGRQTLSKSIVALTGESSIAAQLAELQKHFPEVEMGSYPKKNRPYGYHCHLVLRSKQQQSLDLAYEALQSMLTARSIRSLSA